MVARFSNMTNKVCWVSKLNGSMQLKEALPTVNDGECHSNRALLQHVLNVLIITGLIAKS